MDKPITLVYEEFKAEMANLINNVNLPAFAVESLLRNYLYEITDIVKRQYEEDKNQYDYYLAASAEQSVAEDSAVESQNDALSEDAIDVSPVD